MSFFLGLHFPSENSTVWIEVMAVFYNPVFDLVKLLLIFEDGSVPQISIVSTKHAIRKLFGKH